MTGESSAKAPAPRKGANKEVDSKQKRRQYLPAEERRQSILEAAREVFARDGLKGARTRELARAAGINQATLFEHFSSKEELFVEAVVEPLSALMEGARERTQGYVDAATQGEQLAMLQGGIRQNLESMVDIFPLLLQALSSDQDLGKKLYREKIDPLLQTRAEAVQDFVDDKIDPKLLQLASFGMFFAIALDQAMTGEARDLDRDSQQLMDLIMFGCVSHRREPAKK